MWSHTWIIKVISKTAWVHISTAEWSASDNLMIEFKRSKLFARVVFGIILAIKLSQNKTSIIIQTLHHTPLVIFTHCCHAIRTLSFTSLKVQLLGNLVFQSHFYIWESPSGSLWPDPKEEQCKIALSKWIMLPEEMVGPQAVSSRTNVHNLLTKLGHSCLTVAWSFLVLCFSWSHSCNILLFLLLHLLHHTSSHFQIIYWNAL